jgi:branched-chain amino acid transport system ATP-binding protein
VIASRERVFHFFPRLGERKTQLAGSLSGGEQQMLRRPPDGGTAAAGRRASLGLMPKMVDLCLQTLLSLKREGIGILLVERNTARALDGGSGDRALVRRGGVSRRAARRRPSIAVRRLSRHADQLAHEY